MTVRHRNIVNPLIAHDETVSSHKNVSKIATWRDCLVMQLQGSRAFLPREITNLRAAR